MAVASDGGIMEKSESRSGDARCGALHDRTAGPWENHAGSRVTH